MSAERTRRWRERMSPARRRLERQKDAARHRVRRGHARQKDFQLLGWVPPRNWPGDPFSDPSVTDPHTPIQGEPSFGTGSRLDQDWIQSPAPQNGLASRLVGRLCASLRPSRRKGLDSRGSTVRAEVARLARAPALLARLRPDHLALGLLQAAGAFDLAPNRLHRWARLIGVRLGQAAGVALLCLVADVAFAARPVSSIGAVVAYRLKHLAAGTGDAISRGGPRSLQDVQTMAQKHPETSIHEPIPRGAPHGYQPGQIQKCEEPVPIIASAKEALQDYRSGMAVADIAKKHGVSEQRARDAIMAAMRRGFSGER